MYDDGLGIGRIIRRYGWRKFQKGVLIVSWPLVVVGTLAFILPFVIEGAPFKDFTNTFWGHATIDAGCLSFAAGLSGIIVIPALGRYYSKCETALGPHSDDVPLVGGQPTPDIAALELPISIDLETRKPIARFGAITAWLLFAGMFVTTRNAFVLLPLALVTMGIIVSIVRDHDVALGAGGQQVRVDEDEMIVSSDRTKRDAMMWDDVRVFALIWGGNGIYATKVYMLSSGDHEVRWKHRLRTHWYSLAAPTTSDEVYNQQMNALLSYAVARTGLPLLDMR
jgi:hypothetical protein